MGPELEGERPAAAADFDKLAQDAYNKQTREKGWKRRFDDLSASTRLKYYYQAQKDYTKQTGKPAYSQVKGDTTFKDYFEKQDEAFQHSWLGPKRCALYQQGKYDPLHLANPDTGYVATLDELFVGPAYDSIPEGATSNNPLSPDEPILKRRRKQESSGPVPGEAHIPYLSEAKRIIAEIDQSEVIVAYNEEIKRLQREVNLAEAKLKNSTGRNKEESEKDLATKRDELQKIINGRNIARRNEAIRRFLPEDNPDSPTRQSARKIKFEGVPEADHREALDFVARLLDNTAYRNIPMEEIVVRHTFEVRSYTFDKEIFLSDFPRKTTMHYETGHAVEDVVPATGDKVKAFYSEITTGPDGKRNKREHIPGYLENEFRRETNIDTPSKYCDKEYAFSVRSKPYQTELLAVFIEELYNDPIGLIEKYPEFYEGIIKCLR